MLKGVQQLGSVLSPSAHDINSAGIASMGCSLGDDASLKAGEAAMFSSRSSRIAGPGIGKPAFDSECGKKGSASRQRVRYKALFKHLGCFYCVDLVKQIFTFFHFLPYMYVS